MAAIIGKSFSFKLLENIYPIPDAKRELMENLLTLRKLNILSFDDSLNHTHNRVWCEGEWERERGRGEGEREERGRREDGRRERERDMLYLLHH